MIAESSGPDVHRRGSLEVRSYERSKEQFRLVSCPFCDYEFDDGEHRWVHILEAHGPEDAGLSPSGEAPLAGGDDR